MELEGVVQNGVIVPDDPAALPEGTRVRVRLTRPVDPPNTIDDYASECCVVPADRAENFVPHHDHDRRGTSTK